MFKFRKPKLSLHVITMYRDEDLERLLKQCQPYFDVMRVCDGSGEQSTKDLCRKYGAEYYYRKWDDKYQEQDNVLLDKCKEKDWVFIMDDDELPSKQLLDNLNIIISRANNLGCNMISLPCLLVLDDEPECEINTFIQETRSGKRDPFRKYWLFKYDKSVRSYGTPHRLVETEKTWKVFDQPYPYYHIKTRKGFMINDCIHSFINQQDQKYTVSEAKELREAVKESGWVTSRDVAVGLETGEVPNSLQEFMWKYKDQVDRSISRWFWVYYFIYHQDELPEDFDFKNDVSFRNWVREIKV